VLAACSGGSKGSRPSGTTGASTSDPSAVPAAQLRVPSFPYWANDVFPVRSDRLDAFAMRYAQERGGKDLDLERFLYGWMPLHAFDEIFGGSLPGDLPGDLGGLLLAFHVSGYFGGVWLRGAIDTAQPGTSVLAKLKTTPSREQFDKTIARARRALTAARSDDAADVVVYSRASLFPEPGAAAGFAGDGLAQGFGYNQGYMLQILEHPPEGLQTPAAYGVQCDGVLRCTYATPRLHALTSLTGVEAKLAQHDGAYAEVGPRIEKEQDAYVPKGRAVWSSGLSVKGFTQRDYETLLDVSASFLETLQATALAATQATAERDARLGRRAAVANAAMTIWLAAYTTGLVEGRPKNEVPSFSR